MFVLLAQCDFCVAHWRYLTAREAPRRFEGDISCKSFLYENTGM